MAAAARAPADGEKPVIHPVCRPLDIERMTQSQMIAARVIS